MSKLKIILLASCCFCFLSAAAAVKDDNNKKETTLSIVADFSELMANKVDYKKDILVKELANMDEMILERQLEQEELMFPADELYGSVWNNRWVNPLTSKNIEFPDSADIDCSTFVMPIDDSTVKVTSKYGPRRGRMHRGIDLKVYIGDTIRAAFSGKVRMATFQRRGYGNYIVIRHPNGLETVYGHLSKILIEEDQIVRAGEVIGLGGNTGRSTGSHLHFETRFLGQAIDPAEIIDFANGAPHKDNYVFRNVKVNGKNTNEYTSGNTHPVYHRVKSGETLGAIARRHRTSVNELCRLNGIRSTTTLRIGQQLRVGTTILTNADNASNSNTEKDKKQPEVKEVENNNSAKTGVKKDNSYTSENTTPVYHSIKSGETLGVIAKAHRISVNELCRLNGIKSTTTLRIGQQLRVGTTILTNTDSASNSNTEKDKKQPEVEKVETNSAKTSVKRINSYTSENTTPVYHSIKSGETLGAIAKAHKTSVDELCRLNGIKSTTTLHIGQKLHVGEAVSTGADNSNETSESKQVSQDKETDAGRS